MDALLLSIATRKAGSWIGFARWTGDALRPAPETPRRRADLHVQRHRGEHPHLSRDGGGHRNTASPWAASRFGITWKPSITTRQSCGCGSWPAAPSRSARASCANSHRRIVARSQPSIAGIYSQHARRIAGSAVVFPNPMKVPSLMEAFGRRLEVAEATPDAAFDAHYDLTAIHTLQRRQRPNRAAADEPDPDPRRLSAGRGEARGSRELSRESGGGAGPG